MAKRKISMKGVPEEIRKGARGKRVPEGDYLLKIMEGTWEEGEEHDYISWRFQVAKGKYKGATLYTITSLSPKALWNLRNLIFAAKGKNMAGKAFEFDPEKLVGIIVGATVEDDEYKKKGKDPVIRSRPVDFFPKEKFEEPDEEEEDEDSDDDEEVEEEDTDEEEELEDVEVDEL